jgi:hypothetical protein
VLSAVATFVSSITGKVVLGTAVAAASVGTAHAAHVVDLPGAPRSEAEVVVEADLTQDPAPTTSEAEADSIAAMDDAEPPSDQPVDDAEADDDAETDAEVGGDAGENHGQIVSEFARTTELEGCERGQAIAELASGGRSNRQAPLDNCAKSDDDDPSAESDEEDDDPSDDEVEEPTVHPTAAEAKVKTPKGKAVGHQNR